MPQLKIMGVVWPYGRSKPPKPNRQSYSMIQTPGQTSPIKRNMNINSVTASQQISAKNFAKKSFPKYLSFGVDFGLYKINTHNISGARN